MCCFRLTDTRLSQFPPCARTQLGLRQPKVECAWMLSDSDDGRRLSIAVFMRVLLDLPLQGPIR